MFLEWREAHLNEWCRKKKKNANKAQKKCGAAAVAAVHSGVNGASCFSTLLLGLDFAYRISQPTCTLSNKTPLKPHAHLQMGPFAVMKLWYIN